jgi:hypothetical protein
LCLKKVNDGASKLVKNSKIGLKPDLNLKIGRKPKKAAENFKSAKNPKIEYKP